MGIKVFFDGNIFYRQRYGGINSVYNGIFKCLPLSHEFQCAVTLPRDNSCDNIGRLRKFRMPFIKSFKNINRLWPAFNELCLRNFKPDIFHSTYYTEPFFRKKLKKVLTIHDMIHEIFPSEFATAYDKRLVFLKRKLAFEADMVICVSENTKKDVLSIYKGISERKILVIKNSFNGFFSDKDTNRQKEEFISRHQLFKPYLLYVGRILDNYKNFNLLLDAYISNPEINRDRDLVVVSCQEFSKRQEEKINRLRKNIFKFSKISLPDLRILYNCADLFIFPSRYEGFGIPILEAMACGTPVLASNIPAVSEIADGAVLYFDPFSQEDLERKIIGVINDTEVKSRLVSSGYSNLERYSWDKSACELISVYRSLMHK